jgi:hypothetical protein
MSNIEKINEYFHLPISFDKKSIELNPTIINDLELKETVDPSGTPLYNFAFQPNTIFGEKVTKELSKLYTTNKKYLKDTQQLLKKYKNSNNVTVSYNEIIHIWDDIKNDKNFKEKYHFLDWDWSYGETLNNSQDFLQIMSIYNLASPFISFLMPVFILIIPFFIITIKGYDLSFSKYLNILKDYAKNNAVGQLFTHYHSVPNDKKIYLIVSTFLYLLSIYQNFMTCIRFHKNMIKIHNYFSTIISYIDHSKENINNFLIYSNSLKTYQEFNSNALKHLSVLLDLKNDINKITPYSISLQKVTQLGKIMKIFYSLYKNVDINNSFMWSFGMNGYIDCLQGLCSNIHNNKIKLCKIGDKKNKKNNIFKNAYYPPLINENPIKNDIQLDKNLIITGPNASGKTTILKTSLINIIFSQQFGCGFYSNAYLVPYKYIHCYLNIPDTSGRDSLFQAEARRCKNIIDLIHDNNTETHFCVFDELYSGTNPEEAVNSAKGFMKYLIKFKGVHCMLTTHFYDICNDLEKNPKFENCHMVTEQDETNKDIFNYTYKLEKGISNVQGGMKVLRDMNYPKEIIESNS